jgi:uncharacterized HAD superfamily protein
MQSNEQKQEHQEQTAESTSPNPLRQSAPQPRKEGLRFNEGKTRYDLIPAFAMEKMGDVFTMGAQKYGPRNWENGMAWSKVIASLERHLQAIKRGEDFDKESGNYHAAHVAANAFFLLEYYRIYPQGDDRQHWFRHPIKIGLDIDEVIANFIAAYNKKYNITTLPTSWDYDPLIKQRLNELKNDKEFWLSIEPLIDPSDIPFEPHCYITSRTCDIELTRQWIHERGFPNVPVYQTAPGQPKSEIAKDAGIDVFVDDRFENFVDLENNGICCFLLTAPHNEKYDVGHKRIARLSDIPQIKR